MKLHPRVTRSAVELVKRFEGLRRRAARLPDGGWTIGYGHTLTAREGAVVSPEDADALLYYDLSDVANKVEAWTFTPLNQNQFEALTAFTFNIGTENFRRSTVLKRVNEGQHLMAAAALELWRKADFGGEDLVVDALVRRRAAEKAHYLTPPEGFKPSPTPVLKPTFDHSVIEAAANARAGRSAAIVDAPLEGDTATATVQHPAEPLDDLRLAAFPLVAVAAGGAATARLHQLFPEKAAEPEALAPPVESPFALESETVERPTPSAVNDASLDEADKPALGIEPPPPAQVSAESPGASPFTESFGGFMPPPVRSFDGSPPFHAPFAPAAETSPSIKTPPAFPDAAPLFDVPSPRPAFAVPEGVRSLRLRDDGPLEPEMEGEQPLSEDVAAMPSVKPAPQRGRVVIYSSIGLLGVVLFAAALTSMFTGKATPVNLVIGLIGILLMTPAGGYFLLRFLNARDA